MIMEPVAIIAQQYPRVVIPLIEQAEESIRAVVFDWRVYPTQPGHAVTLFNQAIARAVKRGVDVRVLVANDGVAQQLRAHGLNVRRLHSKKLLHTKMIILDDTRVVIGSHNFTQSAFTLNEEASVLVEMPQKDNSFAKYFDALWGV